MDSIHIKPLREFRAELDRLIRAIERDSVTRPRIVCLCGSTRFADAFAYANFRESLEGRIVLTVGVVTSSEVQLQALSVHSEETKRQLDELHFRKIDMADEILVLNVGGYIGASTRSEIEYACATGKPVRYLEGGNPAKEAA